MTEPSLLQGEERGGSDALSIVTDERRRPCGKLGPPLRGRPEEPARRRWLLARRGRCGSAPGALPRRGPPAAAAVLAWLLAGSENYASALRALPAGSSGRS